MATKKVAKKAPAKKKTVAKKAATKKVVKKVAKKAPVKKSVKKTAKRATKKAVKKSPAKRTTASKIVVPPVPVASSRPATKFVDSKPAAQVTPAASTPVATKKSGSSNRVVLAVVVGILALGAIVMSKGSSSSSTATPSDTASPMPSETASATPTATESKSSSVASTAAPLGIVAHYTAEGATIFWNATTAADGLKGYSVEFRANGGNWSEVATVGADVTKYDITKSDTTGWTSFKISAVYNDGQKAEGKVFGLPGQYK